VGELRDSKDQVRGVGARWRHQPIGETDDGELSSHPIAYDTGFTLPPGTCKPKFPTRENETGNAGTYETSYSP